MGGNFSHSQTLQRKICARVKFVPHCPSSEFFYWSIALDTKPVSRRPILIWLIVSQLLALASLIFWLFAAGISVMAFDSGATPEAWTFVIAVWSYPIWPIVLVIASWIAY